MATQDDQTIADLIDGELDWPKVKQIISNPKDPARFDKVVRVLQSRVRWDETILLPLAEQPKNQAARRFPDPRKRKPTAGRVATPERQQSVAGGVSPRNVASCDS